MDNQHRQIKGYRKLDEADIMMMNEIKEEGEKLSKLIDSLRTSHRADQRWVSIGQTDLQKGLMALVRAVAKPDGF